jgi:hypothetical protein
LKCKGFLRLNLCKDNLFSTTPTQIIFLNLLLLFISNAVDFA